MQPTTACPDFCVNRHGEQPGDAVHHHTHAIDVPQADNGRPLQLFTGFYDHERQMRLEVGNHSLNLEGAQRLLAELQVKVAFMRDRQAELDADALLDGLLDRYQVGDR